jgi:hypothetical protein
MRQLVPALVLGTVLVTVALARQQLVDPAKHNQARSVEPARDQHDTASGLRAQVAELRAEVELMELEHEADKAVLLETLKEDRRLESDDYREGKVDQTIKKIAEFGGLGELMGKTGDYKAAVRTVDDEFKKAIDKDRGRIRRWKQAFVNQAINLNEKKLALAELEKDLLKAK